MSFLPLIIEFFLNRGRRPVTSSNVVARVLGLLLVVVGVMIGIYQLFQLLFPDLGSRESGLVICALLLIGGTILMYVGRSKPQAHPVDDMVTTTTDMIKNLNLGALLTRNAPQIALAALLGGLVLSQLSHFGSFKRLR